MSASIQKNHDQPGRRSLRPPSRQFSGVGGFQKL